MTRPTPDHLALTDAKATRIAREIREGLQGVTPGEWSAISFAGNLGEWVVRAIHMRGEARMTAYIAVSNAGMQDNKANAAHIARCSPDRIAVLLDAFDAQTKEIAELRAALEKRA